MGRNSYTDFCVSSYRSGMCQRRAPPGRVVSLEMGEQVVKGSAAMRLGSDPHQDDGLAAILSAHWQLDRLTTMEPLATGVNNRSWRVTVATDRFILKAYRDASDPDRLDFEHALLATLDRTELPFAVPAPIPTASGVTVVPVGDERWSLFRRIPGCAARRHDVRDAHHAGVALATLHRTLVSVTLDPALRVPDRFGDLASVHPAVLDPVDAIGRLFGQETASIASEAVLRSGELAAGWPTQLIHADYYPANVLVRADSVSGVLDFEYAGRGHRAMDLAIGLAAFGTKRWDDDWSWPVCAAFASAYLRHWPLARTELDAIPMLMLTREATSLVHWLGRHARGLSDRADIEDRGRRFLAVHWWLENNEERLVRALRYASG